MFLRGLGGMHAIVHIASALVAKDMFQPLKFPRLRVAADHDIYHTDVQSPIYLSVSLVDRKAAPS